MAKTVSKVTTDHQEIIHWVEENGGKPASVKGTGDEKDSGVLRFDFPGGASEDHLKHIPWDEWY